MDDLLKDSILQCEEVLASKDLQKAERMINKIVGVFGSQIPDIDQGLDSYTSYLGNHQVDYLGDVTLLKQKLMSHLARNQEKGNALSSLFQAARNKVEYDESLSEQEMKEILAKIDEIEEISKSDEAKNKKWFKLRPTMEWLGTKGLSVAVNILKLITAVLAA
jgi:hypothetical protein